MNAESEILQNIEDMPDFLEVHLFVDDHRQKFFGDPIINIIQPR